MLDPTLSPVYDKEHDVTSGISVKYPESNGEPLAESDFQLVWIVYLLDVLRYFFRQRHDVYVAGNLLVYYEEGAPALRVAPDVFVVFGVSNHKRRTFKVWEEGAIPHFILEVLSPGTISRDRGEKKGLYEFLGVQEYFLLDPIGNLMDPPSLQGYQLVSGLYQPMPLHPLPEGGIALASAVLGLEFHTQGDELRLFNRQTEQYLLTYEEAESARATAEERAVVAEEQVEKVAARVAELEARLRALGEEV